MGQSKFRLNAMLHTDIRGDEGRQNAQLNQKNSLNILPSNLARIGSVQLCLQLQHTAGCALHRPLAVSTAAEYSRMYLTPSTGCAYSCSIQPEVPYTVHWLCLQLQHTAGCTLNRPMVVSTAAVQPDVPYTVHWLCLQLQHTAGCTLHRPLAVPTAAHCRVSNSSLCFKVFILLALVTRK